MNQQLIKELILKTLPDAEIVISDMTGGGDHLELNITSSAFKDRPLLAQHRMVMNCLSEALKEQLHAVKLKTKSK